MINLLKIVFIQEKYHLEFSADCPLSSTIKLMLYTLFDILDFGFGEQSFIYTHTRPLYLHVPTIFLTDIITAWFFLNKIKEETSSQSQITINAYINSLNQKSRKYFAYLVLFSFSSHGPPKSHRPH